MHTNLSIIIPAYNEQTRLGETVGKILDYIEKENLSAELIVVDDGSTRFDGGSCRKSLRRISSARNKSYSL